MQLELGGALVLWSPPGNLYSLAKNPDPLITQGFPKLKGKYQTRCIQRFVNHCLDY